MSIESLVFTILSVTLFKYSGSLKFDDTLPSSLIDSNVNLKWKQRKSKELKHAP
jgi:hypothetical protein